TQSGTQIGSSSFPTNNYKTGKTSRSTQILEKTALESELSGFESSIAVYSPNTTNGCPVKSNVDRTTSIKKNHHLSEFEIVDSDGGRRIYNIPVYSIKQKEVSFNTSGNTVHCETGLVNYSSADASSSNSNGRNNFYQEREIPGYAHSFLIRAILSPDYNDRTGDGLSEDDFGN